MKRKIILADDHQLFIEGVRTVIEEIEDVEISATVNKRFFPKSRSQAFWMRALTSLMTS